MIGKGPAPITEKFCVLMRAVIDANYLIDRDVPFAGITAAYIPESVEAELRDRATAEYYRLYSFAVHVRRPSASYVAEVAEAVENRHFGVSSADIDVVALMLELSDEAGAEWVGEESLGRDTGLVCLTRDNGVRSALALFGLCGDPGFEARRYMLRCFGCYEMYDHAVDFCRKCGHNTVTRVAVVGDDNRVLLSKHFRFRPRVLRDSRGTVIRSEDQREYARYRAEQKRKAGE